MTVSEIYIHARFADGPPLLVGRHRIVEAPAERPYGLFRYVGSWLKNSHGRSYALDPLNLPLLPGDHILRKRGLLPGALADAGPDLWGRRLALAAIDPSKAPRSSIDWLLTTGDERVGNLCFSATPDAPAPMRGYASVQNLAELAEAFERITQGEASTQVAEWIFWAGRSLGGARPKAIVEHEDSLWIAKFQRADDDYDQCAAEFVTMRLAGACGIDVAETRLVDLGTRKAVLVKRFDRDRRDSNSGSTDVNVVGEPGVTVGADSVEVGAAGAIRGYYPTAHYVSALSLLDLDETSDGGSYPAIASVLRRVGSAHVDDRNQLFRRMVFNVLSGNRDDHLKNHGLVYNASSGWRLSQAFDIVPQPNMDAMQAIGVGRSGVWPTIENCLSRRGEFGLGEDDANSIVDEIADVLRGWRSAFENDGVDPRTIDRIARAFSQELDKRASISPGKAGSVAK